MIWWLVWTVLVVGTVVGAFFLARDLWRRAVALGAELGRASDAAARLSDQVAELSEVSRRVTVVHPLLATADDTARWRGGLAARRAARDARRAASHAAAHERWDRLWR